MILGFGANGQMLATLLESPLSSLPDDGRAYVAFDLDPARVQVGTRVHSRGAAESSNQLAGAPSCLQRCEPRPANQVIWVLTSSNLSYRHRLGKQRATMWCTGTAAEWQSSRQQASHGLGLLPSA